MHKTSDETNPSLCGENSLVFPLCFVSYYPGQDFFKRLKMLMNAGYPVWVYDNSGLLPSGFAEFVKSKAFKLFREGDNLGLGRALRILMQQAKAAGFEFALYFDQDTVFSLDSLDYIKHRAGNYMKQQPGYAAVRFGSDANPLRAIMPPADRRLLINSGSLFRLQALEQSGWHDDDYFVEGVDYKFCLDARAAGFRLGEDLCCPGIDHHREQPEKTTVIFGRVIAYRPYALRRHLQFLQALLRLTLSALKKGEMRYGYIFFRNFFTHIIAQGSYYLAGQVFGKQVRPS